MNKLPMTYGNASSTQMDMRRSLSQESCFELPKEFKGGTLADEMSLEETCTMPSLIASDLASESIAGRVPNDLPHGLTLIVVPLPLLEVWKMQIGKHFVLNLVVFRTYYGSMSIKIKLHGCDIVITTWHRIVLNKAHVVKNKAMMLLKLYAP